jgi:hypothetical protein
MPHSRTPTDAVERCSPTQDRVPWRVRRPMMPSFKMLHSPTTLWIIALVCVCAGCQPPTSAQHALPSVVGAAEHDASAQVDAECGVDAAIEPPVEDSSAANETVTPAASTPPMEVIPPSRQSCDKLLKRVRALPPLPERERDCCTPEGLCLDRGNCEEAQRRTLMRFAAEGRAGSHPMLFLRVHCRFRDPLCTSCVEWRLQQP